MTVHRDRGGIFAERFAWTDRVRADLVAEQKLSNRYYNRCY